MPDQHGLTKPGERVLDIACGTGLAFSRHRSGIGPSGRVVGVDLTPAMLDVAKRRIQRHGWENVEVREADAASLPFESASFDKALCCSALSIIPSYQSTSARSILGTRRWSISKRTSAMCACNSRWPVRS